MLDVYRSEHACWIVTGSSQYGRARAETYRVPQALKYYRALRRQATVAFKVSPVSAGDKLPRYQVDKSFNYVDGGLPPAGSGNDRVQTARLHVISGVNPIRAPAPRRPHAPPAASPSPPGARGGGRDQHDNAVLLDTRSNSALGSVALPGRTRAVAVAPDGGRAFVAAGATVSVIDLNARLGAGSILMGGSPLAVAVSPDGTHGLRRAQGRDRDDRRRAAMIRTGERKLSGTPIDARGHRDAGDRGPGRAARSRSSTSTTGRLVRRIKLAGAAGVGARRRTARRGSRRRRRARASARPPSRIVRIEPANGGISGSVALGTDGGGGLGISPDATKAIVAPGAKLKRRATARPRSSTSPAARPRPPADRRRPRPARSGRPTARASTSPTRPQDALDPLGRDRATACARSPSPARPAGSSSSPASRC